MVALALCDLLRVRVGVRVGVRVRVRVRVRVSRIEVALEENPRVSSLSY